MGVLILGVAFTLLIIPSGYSWAASLVVNSTTDAVDASPGDGICATSAGACTLRAAIQEANASTGADTISVPAGIYTLTLGTGSVDPPEVPEGAAVLYL